ncbi:Uncharacterised protein [Halioglobus japonicus]|nr:Uncharacterised protein [Halioglobus japonicus]
MHPQGSELLWGRVLAIAESMEAQDCSLEEITGFLNGLDEGFASAADPVDNFPEYVAMRLCRSMALVLQRVDQQRH